MPWGSIANTCGASSGVRPYGFLIKGNPYASLGNAIAISGSYTTDPIARQCCMSRDNGATWVFARNDPWGSGTGRYNIWYKVWDQNGTRLVENCATTYNVVCSIGGLNSAQISSALSPADGFITAVYNFTAGTGDGTYTINYSGGMFGSFSYKAPGDSGFGSSVPSFFGTPVTLTSGNGTQSVTVGFRWSTDPPFYGAPVGYPSGNTNYTAALSTLAEPAYAYWQPMLGLSYEFPIKIQLFNRGYSAGSGATNQEIKLYYGINEYVPQPTGTLVATSNKVTLVGATNPFEFTLSI